MHRAALFDMDADAVVRLQRAEAARDLIEDEMGWRWRHGADDMLAPACPGRETAPVSTRNRSRRPLGYPARVALGHEAAGHHLVDKGVHLGHHLRRKSPMEGAEAAGGRIGAVDAEDL